MIPFFHLLGLQATGQNCNSSFTLDSIVCGPGPGYYIHTQLCVGGGVDIFGNQGAFGNTGRFLISFSAGSGFVVNSWTPVPGPTSDTLGTNYPGANVGPQPAFNAQQGIYFNNPAQWYTCVFSTSTCGNPHQDCTPLVFHVNSLPDSIRAYGIEGGDNLFAGCLWNSSMLIDFATTAPWTAEAGIDSSYCFPGTYQIGTSTGINFIYCDTSTYTYSWTPTTGLSNPNIPNPFATITTPIMYYLTVTDSGGYTSTDSVYFDFTGTPTSGLPRYDTLCSPGSTLQADLGYAVYDWSTGATTPAIAPPTAGDYWVEITDFCGVTSVDSITVAFLNGPLGSPGLPAFDTLCSPGDSLHANPGFFRYIWSTGDTTASIAVPPLGSTSGGPIWVGVGDTCGNFRFDTCQVFFLNPVPPVTGLPPTDSVCPGGDTIYAQPGQNTYLWSTGATTDRIFVNSPGNYWLEVTHICGDTVRDTISIGIATPQPPVLGPDTLFCRSDSVLLYWFGAGSNYQWSTGSIAAQVYISTTDTVWLSIDDANGCRASDTVVATMDTTCVWPGDFNYDGTVDLSDAIWLSAGYGNTGPIRPNGSISFTGQPAPDWTGFLSTGANHKHLDANANGLADSLDLSAVAANYLMTHNKTLSIDTADYPLIMVPNRDTLYEGDTLFLGINLGTAAFPADTILALGFQLAFDTSLVDSGSAFAYYDTCWLGQQGVNLYQFFQENWNDGVLNVAIGRTDQSARSGQGRIAGIGLVMQDDIAGKVTISEILRLGIPFARVLSGDESEVVVLAPDDSVLVRSVETTMPSQVENHLRIFPNPAQNRLHVEWLGQGPAEFALTDLSGKTLKTTRLEPGQEHLLRTESFPRGFYLARITAGHWQWTQKIILQ